MTTQTILTTIPVDELKNLISEALRYEISQIQIPETTLQEDTLIKISDVAELFKVSKVTIHDWKKKGLIPYHRLSNKIYFKKSEVLAAMKSIKQHSKYS